MSNTQFTVADLAEILSGFTPQRWTGYDVRSGQDTDPAEGGESAYISNLEDLRPAEGDARAPQFFSLADITIWGDHVGSDYNRSNLRSLERDYPDTFVTVRDAMGAEWLVLPVSSLLAMDGDAAESLCRTLTHVRDDYPLYDEEDHGALEMELADDAWDAWVRFDLTRALRNADVDDEVLDAIDEDILREAFYTAVGETPEPYHCESADSIVFPYWDDVVASLAKKFGSGDDAPDFWQLIESAPKYATAVADLAHWSTNYDAGRSPFALFLDLIGYSADELGSALYSAEHGDYGLGYVEAGKLAAALTEWADRPGDVRDFAALLIGAGR